MFQYSELLFLFLFYLYMQIVMYFISITFRGRVRVILVNAFFFCSTLVSNASMRNTSRENCLVLGDEQKKSALIVFLMMYYIIKKPFLEESPSK